MAPAPADPPRLELIGGELALAWPDGREAYLSAPFLRSRSPSSENTGEPDLFGNVSGGQGPRDHQGVSLLGFHYVGNYAVRLVFSDGHDSGLYSWDLLANLAEET